MILVSIRMLMSLGMLMSLRMPVSLQVHMSKVINKDWMTIEKSLKNQIIKIQINTEMYQ